MGVYPMKQLEAYFQGTMTDDARKVKLIEAGFEAAPLALVQLYQLAVDPPKQMWPQFKDFKLELGYARWISVVGSAFSVGSVFAEADVADKSVFRESARTTTWKAMLAVFRGAEVSARISGVVGLQLIFCQ